MPSREYGDWQTPDGFANRACFWLKSHFDIAPTIILEPTCGLGSFLAASTSAFPNYEIAYGEEINSEYVAQCAERFSGQHNIEVSRHDFFLDPFFPKTNSELLVIGNPPWVTNSELSAMGGNNLPDKSNIRGLKGIDAITGASNFDICEFIILRLMQEYRETNTVIAMLCKTSVARNLVLGAFKDSINARFHIAEFDAHKVFDINASACMFVCDFRHSEKPVCMISSIDDESLPFKKLICEKGKLSYELSDSAKRLDGECFFTWRQGIKHDCSRIMEIKEEDGRYINGLGESFEIESDLVFPLLKSSELKQPWIQRPARRVIVTQRNIGDDTRIIESHFPKTWHYLESHGEMLDGRKSSIYRGKPRFSMFGIGDYSFAEYKVAISGFYKEPRFSLVDGYMKPIMLDDTCYFIGIDDFDVAYSLMLLLNSKVVNSFLKEVSFADAKRPYTKKVLQRIDLRKSLGLTSLEELRETEKKLGLEARICDEMLRRLTDIVEPREQTLF